MTVVAKNVVPAVLLSGAATKYYTVPADTRAVLKNVNIANNTGGAIIATLYIVSAGAAVGPPFDVLPSKSVAAGDAISPDNLVNQVLEPLSEIWALGAGLNLRVSGYEIS